MGGKSLQGVDSYSHHPLALKNGRPWKMLVVSWKKCLRFTWIIMASKKYMTYTLIYGGFSKQISHP